MFAPPLVLLAITGFGFLTMSLWNALLPIIFHLPVITFWQALGLLLLARLFFGGHHWNKGGHSHMRNKMIEKWEKMTPEEREQLRSKWPHQRHPWSNCFGDRGPEKEGAQTV